ncbi:MAG: hypothetical protein K2Z80_14980 [Xanthobacteraceae bacterium]|nr:hypothetical protein [Xanthobacteraceae bacterium]
MTIVLLIVGLLATAGGFVAIGFGIPNYAFGLGNTLIIAGSVSAATGLILIGLAAVYGQLRRINAALKGAPGRLGRAESVEALVPPAARMTPAAPPSPVPTRAAPSKPDAEAAPPLPSIFGPEPPQAEPRTSDLPPRMPDLPRMAEPPRMPEPPPRMPEPKMPELARAPEPRFPATASEAATAAGPLDWLRSKSKPAAPSMPTPPIPMPAASAPPPMPTPPAPPVSAEPPVLEVADEAPLSPRPPQRPMDRTMDRPMAAEPAPRAEPPMPQVEQAARDKDGFDLVWPDRAAASPAGEAAKREPSFGMPLPPIPARPRGAKPADRRLPGPASKVGAERGPAILKSGVIDGMPYTLYADGSIEAELPQGTVKFASVDALRSHLEKQS